MTISADALRQLHRIHRQLTDLRERLVRGPKQIKAAQGSARQSELELTKAKEAFTKARVASDEKQLHLKEREDRMKDLRLKLNACSSNREYQTLVEQIAADEKANSVLSDEIFETLERIDETQEKVTRTEGQFEKAKEDLSKATARVAESQQHLESELARVNDELVQAEAGLPGDFKAEYDRMIKARGEDALAEVEGECCGGCFQTLTPQTMNLLYMSKPVFCKNCGCLLYLQEDRTVGRE